MLVNPSLQEWSGQLTERWLVSQCCHMAASLSNMHRVADLKMRHLPRLLFLRSGRLANDVIHWLSPSKSQLGNLVLGNLSLEPPGSHESPPEYFILSKKQLQPSTQESSGHTTSSDLQPAGSHAAYKPVAQEINFDGPDKPGEAEKVLVLRDIDTPTVLSPTCIAQTPQNDTLSIRSISMRSIEASRFHVWCLAIVWLNLITWFVLGPQGQKDFALNSRTVLEQNWLRSDSGGKSTTHHNSPYRLNSVFAERIAFLRRQKRCTAYVRAILDLILRRMLVTDVAMRASSQHVADTLMRLERGWEMLMPVEEEVVFTLPQGQEEEEESIDA